MPGARGWAKATREFPFGHRTFSSQLHINFQHHRVRKLLFCLAVRLGIIWCGYPWQHKSSSSTERAELTQAAHSNDGSLNYRRRGEMYGRENAGALCLPAPSLLPPTPSCNIRSLSLCRRKTLYVHIYSPGSSRRGGKLQQMEINLIN